MTDAHNTRNAPIPASCLPHTFYARPTLDVAREGNASLDVTDRAIDSHIKNLRKKLDAVLPGADVIHSIYGLGYRFDL